MIGINGLSHFTGRNLSGRLLFDDLNLRVNPPERVGILAKPGSGKTTLARILAGAAKPDFGAVVGDSTLSWPLNYAALLHSDLTALANVRNIAAAKFLNVDDIVARAEAILGEPLDATSAVKKLPPGQKLRVHLAMTLAVPFDCYLADEWPAIPDQKLLDRVTAQLTSGPARPGLILLTRHAHLIERFCTRALVLDQGRLIACETIAQATDIREICEERERVNALS